MSVLTGKLGAVYIIDEQTPFTTEAMTEELATGIYQIDDATLQMWDPNVALIVSTGTLDTSYFDHGINWFEGKIKLTDTGLTPTVSGTAIDLQQVGKVSTFSMTITSDVAEITEIGDTWKKNMSLGKSATVSLSRYRFDELFNLVEGDDIVLLKLYESADSGYWCQTLRTSFAANKAINAIDTETVSFTVTGNVFYFEEA